MTQATITEARLQWSRLIARVERGETIVITRRGKPVARLIPPQEKILEPLPDLMEVRSSIKIKGRSLTEELLAMRREERY